MAGPPVAATPTSALLDPTPSAAGSGPAALPAARDVAAREDRTGRDVLFAGIGVLALAMASVLLRRQVQTRGAHRRR